MKEIQTIYRARFDVGIRARPAAEEAIQNFAGTVAGDEVYTSNWTGGPCWTAYCIAEASNREALERWVGDVKAEARRIRVKLDWDC